MRAWPALLAALLLSTALEAAPASADAAWQALYDQAMQQYRAGDLPAAARSATEALERARAAKGRTPPYVASSLNALALIRQAQGERKEAAALLAQALDLSEQALGAHLNTGTLAYNLGQALEGLERPADALPRYERSLAIAEGLPPGRDAEALRQNSLTALARIQSALGRAADAEASTRRLLASTAAASTRAEALALQARALESQGRRTEAIGAWRESLALREAATPPDRQAEARSLSELANALTRNGRHDEAEPLHRRALAQREALDPDDPEIATHLNELGLWHLARKETAAAAPLLARALVLVEARTGPDSLEAARIVASQAQLHDVRSEEAQALNRRALAIYARHAPAPEALLGQAQAVNGLATAVYLKRRYKEAEPLLLQALALTEQALGPDDPGLLAPLDNLQSLYLSQNRPSAAQPYAKRAEALRQKGKDAATP